MKKRFALLLVAVLTLGAVTAFGGTVKSIAEVSKNDYEQLAQYMKQLDITQLVAYLNEIGNTNNLPLKLRSMKVLETVLDGLPEEKWKEYVNAILANVTYISNITKGEDGKTEVVVSDRGGDFGPGSSLTNDVQDVIHDPVSPSKTTSLF